MIINRSGYAAIGLYHPKDSKNVGAVLRAAGCYNSSMVAVCGKRYKKASTDTLNTHNKLPLILTEDLKSIVPFNCVPVAVELLPEAVNIVEYTHPKNAFYIFGPEDGSLGFSITTWCRDIIYIPTRSCMNLAATVNVVLYDRLAKQSRSNNERMD